MYNFGSLAFGSACIAVAWYPQVLFGYIANRLEGPGRNRVSRVIVSCCSCCLDCFHGFIKFIDENAYIQIALTADSFCTSAYSAYSLALKNSATFTITNGIGGVMRLLGRFSICITNTFIGYIIISNVEDLRQTIDNPVVILAAIGLISFLMSSVFMDVYALVSLTILQCLYVDVDICV